MKTVNITLADAEHKRLSKLKELLDLSNIHETVAKMIDITWETCMHAQDKVHRGPPQAGRKSDKR